MPCQCCDRRRKPRWRLRDALRLRFGRHTAAPSADTSAQRKENGHGPRTQRQAGADHGRQQGHRARGGRGLRGRRCRRGDLRAQRRRGGHRGLGTEVQGRPSVRARARRGRWRRPVGLDRGQRQGTRRHRRAGVQRERAGGRRQRRHLGEVVPRRHDAHGQCRAGGAAVPGEVAERVDRADLQRVGLRGRLRGGLVRCDQGGADPLRQGPEPPARRQGHPRELRVARQHLLRRRHLADHREEHARPVQARR